MRIHVRRGTTLHPGNNPVSSATQDSGLEFSKQRPYVPGDDLRHIDWIALARQDTTLVKTFRAEREAPLHILVDHSASMAVPPEDEKPYAAVAIATCLAYVSLRNRDPVRVATMDQLGTQQIAPLLRHPNRLQMVVDGITARPPSGTTDLERGIDGYLRLTRLPGIAIVISDFFVPAENYQRALRRLQAGGYAVAAIRVLGRQDRDPTLRTGRLRLYDVETGRDRIIDLTLQNRARYLRALEDHNEVLSGWCAANAIPVCVVDTSQPPSVAMIDRLPRAGILR